MSVICQNFVQNAWKKDLCSNCFKSIGDHEFCNEDFQDESVSIDTGDNGQIDDRCSSTPQTTWKSLITHKNGKNAQLFKLETGFHGRLLTINTANVFERKSLKNSGFTNGSFQNKSSFEQKQNAVENNKIVKNGRMGTDVHKKNGTIETHEPPQVSTVAKNKSKLPTETEKSVVKNGEVLKNGEKVNSTKVQSNGQNGEVCTETKPSNVRHGILKATVGFATDESEVRNGNLEVNTKTEGIKNESPRNRPGILKKTSSATRKEIRRNSSVGFKEEDPVIIGYGGRDFSTDELEWEMASSDGEGGTTSDSLDDNEDDRSFSKITKVNTEYNSNSAILPLEGEQQNGIVDDLESGLHNDVANDLKVNAQNGVANNLKVNSQNGIVNNLKTNSQNDNVHDLKAISQNGDAYDLKANLQNGIQQKPKQNEHQILNETKISLQRSTPVLKNADKKIYTKSSISSSQKASKIKKSPVKEQVMSNDVENEKQITITKLNSKNNYESSFKNATDDETKTENLQISDNAGGKYISLKSDKNPHKTSKSGVSKQRKESIEKNNSSKKSMKISNGELTHLASNASAEVRNSSNFNCEITVSKRHHNASSAADVTKATENSQNNATIHHGASIVLEYGQSVVVQNRNNDGSLSNEYVPQKNDTTAEPENSVISVVTSLADDFLSSRDTGQLHEAINSTLAARHCMEGYQDCDLECNDRKECEQLASSTEKECAETDDTAVEFSLILSSNETSKNETTDVSEVIGACNIDTPNDVKPRVSFLHGSRSDYSDSQCPPSAVYTPGNDFFVPRSGSASSLSSSSSEDQKKEEPTNENENIKNGGELKDKNCPANENNTAVKEISASEVTVSAITSKIKPALPIKPRKPPMAFKTRPPEPGHYAKPIPRSTESPNLPACETELNSQKVSCSVLDKRRENSISSNSSNHYAEVNVSNHIGEKCITSSDDFMTKDGDGIREYKLAALAVELEQARHSGSSKRQAPAPPKIPEPPQEEPPSCLERTPSPLDVQTPLPVYKTDTVVFSSASSTTSSSSQDIDTGFGSWNIHGDEDDENHKSPKWKNSFLLAQYSKCKMLAKGYANNYHDDGPKSRKRFSLKKLLKLGKESDISLMTADGRCANHPKAWKYSEGFDRPRAKLEIIHPMDLETKTLTVNPGFDPERSRSTSSFSSNGEVISIRHSGSSSECGSYYSDSISASPSCHQKNRESEYASHRGSSGNGLASGRGTPCSNLPIGSSSPTPSRCSAISQASTLTSGSSKNGSHISGNRPPKPPPPPRAHSLLPDDKKIGVTNGTCKIPVADDISVSCDSPTTEELKRSSAQPQAPKRLYRAGMKSAEYANFDTKSCSSLDQFEQETMDETERKSSSSDENPYECVRTKQEMEYDAQQYEDVELPTGSQTQNLPQVLQVSTVEVKQEGSYASVFSKGKCNLTTKAPPRPSPIYSKLPFSNAPKENAWKTLENSYTVLSSNNRDILAKLVEQSIKKRPSLPVNEDHNFQWEEFALNNEQVDVSSFGDNMVYDAFLIRNPDCQVTLLISLQHSQPQSSLNSSSHCKYPVLGHFCSDVPSSLILDERQPTSNVDAMACTVYVLDRSNVTTIEKYIQDVPEELTENLEKEICLIVLQMIHELKGLQAQGIEEIEPSFHNLFLAKTENDIYYTLIFLSENFFEDGSNAYSSMADDCKVSLCQYALMLIFQIFKIDSIEELNIISSLKFSKREIAKIFENIVSLLLEEKAVSLSQVKTLLECFMWGVQTLIYRPEFDNKETDVMLHRWMDLERSAFIKNIIVNTSACITAQAELHSQFLIRSNIRNVKDIVSYL